MIPVREDSESFNLLYYTQIYVIRLFSMSRHNVSQNEVFVKQIIIQIVIKYYI